jgi:GT2 family glycosyltransferase
MSSLRDNTVAVVIPTWDGQDLLAECLASLTSSVGAAGSPPEIVVVDNGSRDGSVEMVRRDFPGVALVINETNRGFAAACNQGARATTANYVAFLNNDARAQPGWLEPLVDKLASEADVAAVGSLVLDRDGKRVDFGRAGLTPLARGVQLDYREPLTRAANGAAEQLFANGAAMLTRRELFLEVGGFDERFFAYYEDVDLGWRFWILGWRVMLEPASTVLHRHHGTSRRLRREQVDFLLTRNAIASAVKNVETETFGQLLPVLLLAEGANLAAALGSRDRFHTSGFGAFAFRPAHLGSVVERARNRAGSEALRVYRRNTVLRARIMGMVARLFDPRETLVPIRSGAVVAALEEVLWGWPALLASRAAIQAQRKRSDREVSKLFGLDRQRRSGRADAVSPDETREAVYRAFDAAGIDWLLPRG